MVEIEQILVLTDPDSPDSDPSEITVAEVKEYGERFFISGHHVEVYLSNGEVYSCVKSSRGWDTVALESQGLDIAKLPKRTSSPLTFEEVLELLLTEANTKDITSLS